MHLTNYAINKSSATYFASDNPDSEVGHKRSLFSIYKTLEKEGVDVARVKEEIRDIILKTLISIHPELVHNYRTCQPSDKEGNMCFEILGIKQFSYIYAM